MWQIEALRGPVTVDDLSIRVHSGSPQWITDSQYKGSFCLQKLLSLGSVRATQKSRSRDVRAAPPRKVRSRTPLKPPPPPVVEVSGEPRPPRISKLDLEDVARRAAQEAVSQAAFFFAQTPLPREATSPEALEAAVARALSRGRQSDSSPGRVEFEEGPAEPVFIPEGIVAAGEPAKITVESGSTEDSSLGDAAAALRNLKKRKKT
jgi:hypothetical protein